jgi:hypothetical protein
MILPFMLAIAASAAQPAPAPPARPEAPPLAGRQPYYVLARDLQRRCSEGTAGADYCYAYVISVYDTVRSYELWLGLREMCVPAGTVQSDLVKTVLDYINGHPEVQDSLAASAAVVALQQRYACPGTAASRTGH